MFRIDVLCAPTFISRWIIGGAIARKQSNSSLALPLFVGFVGAFTTLGQTPPVVSQKAPVRLLIEAREKGNRNVALELTRDMTKACAAVVSITDNAAAAEFRLAPVSDASTLYRADGIVEHIFSARWTVSGLTKEVCSYLQVVQNREPVGIQSVQANDNRQSIPQVAAKPPYAGDGPPFFQTPDGAVFILREITLIPTSGIPIFKAMVDSPPNGGMDSTYVDIVAEIGCADGVKKAVAFAAGLGDLKPGENHATDTIVSARGAINADCHLNALTSLRFKSGKHVGQDTLDDREQKRIALEHKISSKVADAEADAEIKKAEADMARRTAEEQAVKERELKSNCSDIYKQTSSKKVSDLTVVEDRAVKACESLGYYN